MGTNVYFNNTHNIIESRLVEDLFVETIKIFGTDAFYIPRDDQNQDIVYGEDPLKSFTSAFPVEVYNSDTTDFEGQKEMFSKFGIEIKNDYTVIMSRRTYKQRVKNDPRYERPREGDLIYIPHVSQGGTLFEITWVEPDKDFFLLGRKLPYYYEMKLEPFKYSQEIMQTGIVDVDQIPSEDGYTIALSLQMPGIGNYIFNEWVYQGNSLDTATTKAIVGDWDVPSGILKVTNISGVFVANTNIIGDTSGAVYSLLTYDPMQNNIVRDAFNNEVINTEGTEYINFSETNPFGNL